MNILALDVATKCGWAVTGGIYGYWDLSPKRDESSGMRLIRFRSKLKEIISTMPIDIVVFERTAGFHTGALIVQSELHGVLKVTLEDLNLQYKAYSATEIKKFATGKGNAGKPAMIEAACRMYGYKGSNDNEADALHILHLAIQDLQVK